jgi:non-ribosomal peptide synthase protein (TIGR01720 family)
VDGEPGLLFLVAHHLAVDAVSWRILLEDLRSLCSTTGEVKLPPKTTSFKAWAEGLEAAARTPEVAADAEHWLATSTAPAALPVDEPLGTNTVATARTVSSELTVEETETLLREVPRAYRTGIEEVLLTALARAFAGWTGHPALRLDLEGHGRDAGEVVPGADLSRTVGWFTSLYPVVLEVGAGPSPGEDLKAVKERLRSVPRRGLGHGLLRHLGEGELAHRLRAQPAAEVLFNYLGQQDRGPTRVEEVAEDFGPAPESAGPHRGPRGPRSHLLEILGRITGGRLLVHFIYGAGVHRRATIERLGADFLRHLRELIAHCSSRTETEHTPSDFPDIELSQESLDRALAELELD